MACSIKSSSCDTVGDAIGYFEGTLQTKRITDALKNCNIYNKDIDEKNLCNLGVITFAIENGCNTKKNTKCKIPKRELTHAKNIANNFLTNTEELSSWSYPNKRLHQLKKEIALITSYL